MRGDTNGHSGIEADDAQKFANGYRHWLNPQCLQNEIAVSEQLLGLNI